MSAVSPAGADSADRSNSRRATRPRVLPGSSGRRLPADRRHKPAPDRAPRRRPFPRRRRGRGRHRPGDVRRPPSLSRRSSASRPRCCRLLTRSLPDTALSPRHRLMTPAPTTALGHAQVLELPIPCLGPAPAIQSPTPRSVKNELLWAQINPKKSIIII